MRPPNPARLSAAIAGLFPPGVAACELRDPADPDLLLPAEAAGLGNSVPQRAREFTGGRLCARRALAEFGIEGVGLAVGGGRQVAWPQGMVGSITHTTGLCAAAVARRRSFAALGLDSEVVGDVKANIWPKICVEPEIAWLKSLAPHEQPMAAAVIFAAKEAFYKCQYPLGGERIGFHDLQVIATRLREPDSSYGELRLRPLRPMAFEACVAAPLRARFLLHQGFASVGVAATAAESQ
jgi:4'-phosphopantetheinyl transferase EntD